MRSHRGWRGVDRREEEGLHVESALLEVEIATALVRTILVTQMNKPSTKMPITPNFCAHGNCSFFTSGKGNNSTAKSVMILMIAYAYQKASVLVHFAVAVTRGSQKPATGTHWKIVDIMDPIVHAKTTPMVMKHSQRKTLPVKMRR